MRERVGKAAKLAEDAGDASSEWTIVEGELRDRRRALEKELVEMTGAFKKATDTDFPSNLSVATLRSKRGTLLEELFRVRKMQARANTNRPDLTSGR